MPPGTDATGKRLRLVCKVGEDVVGIKKASSGSSERSVSLSSGDNCANRYKRKPA